MKQSQFLEMPFVKSVFHPSDFSEASRNAFHHALAVALRRQTRFIVLHAGGSRDSWLNFPPVRATLEKWGLLEKGSPRSAVFEELKIRVEKVQLGGLNPLGATLGYLQKHPTDLIVLSTEGREGLPRWIKPSAAEKLAQKSQTMTLFVPAAARGFVSPEDGSVSLKKILVPVDRTPSPLPALEYATRITRMAEEPVQIILCHIGDSTTMPALDLPESSHWTWGKEFRRGEVVDSIVQIANQHNVDLIVMATAGRDGILDALRGSVTEQVLRKSPCPLLAVPGY